MRWQQVENRETPRSFADATIRPLAEIRSRRSALGGIGEPNATDRDPFEQDMRTVTQVYLADDHLTNHRIEGRTMAQRIIAIHRVQASLFPVNACLVETPEAVVAIDATLGVSDGRTLADRV